MLSEHLFFITERITDILKFEKENKAERITKQIIIVSLHELRNELSWVVDYVRDVEQRPDEQQRDYHPFYLDLRRIANSFDYILNCVFSNDVSDHTADVINNLVDKIRNVHKFLPSTSTNNYDIHIVGNINGSGGRQIINYDPSLSRTPTINRISRPKTYGEYPESDLVGFEQEIQTLLHHLTKDNQTHVVGIVGMGGLGKTTLAKHVYHHSDIKTHFTRKIWVCISQSWDKTTILKEICSQVVPEAKEKDYGEAIRSLSEHLRSYSYLLVLDDMWSIDAWCHISPAFPPCSRGSKVVVTSRNKVVPLQFDGIVHIVEPKPLDDKQSRELFKKKALLPENISGMLLQLGEKMVKECEGLPLAIVALAGVLRMDITKRYWESISKSLTDNILKQKNQSTQGVVKEVLELSYYELDHHLKQCVLYLRLFPEDYQINAVKLMRMWIAEGLISTNEESRAEEYLDEIVQRHIVKVVKTNFMGQVKRIRIHDLFLQMFVDIDQKKGFLKDELRLAPIYGDHENNFYIDDNILERIFDTQTNSQVRSFILLHPVILEEDNILHQLCEKFRLLRVLILHEVQPYPLLRERLIGHSTVVMSEEIGNLIHLRYLELGGRIEHFESIGNLVNLWTLDLRNIFVFVEKTAQMNFNLCKLKELRHLHFPVYNDYCLELGRLKKLKTLCYVNGGEWLLSWMPVLSVDLHELRIFIPNRNSKEQVEAVFRTPSITSNNLQTLELFWNGFYYELHDMNILSNCESLNQLRLVGAITVGTPILFPPNLIKLEIQYTKFEDREVMNIISNSCPLLKILIFGHVAYKGSELVCNANSFLQLEKLTFHSQENLRMWIIETSAMPSLHYLEISCFMELDVNPEGWTFISNIPLLRYHGHKNPTTKFEEKLRLIRNEDQKQS